MQDEIIDKLDEISSLLGELREQIEDIEWVDVEDEEKADA